MWYTPPGVANLLFDKSMEITNGYYGVPGLIWHFGTTLRLFAYTEYKGLDTVLYRAPFPNTSSSGVCFGTASSALKDKKHTFIDMMKLVKKVFYNSEFTHISGTGVVNGNYAHILNTVYNKEGFPPEFLVKADMTLKEYIKKLTTNEQIDASLY